MTYIKGIDISHWQGKIDFAKLVANEIEFAIFKAGEIPTSSKIEYTDDMYARNIREAKEYGIISGAYYFFHPAISASAQAKHFLKIIGGFGVPDLPLVIDVEVTDNRNPADCAKVLKAMIDYLEAAGQRKPIIYTRNGLWVNQYGNPDWGKEHLFWLAQYNTTLTNQDPKIRENIVMWQYTDRLRLPGIGVNLDGNYWLKSSDQLEILSGQVQMTVPAPSEPHKAEPFSKPLISRGARKEENSVWWKIRNL